MTEAGQLYPDATRRLLTLTGDALRSLCQAVLSRSRHTSGCCTPRLYVVCRGYDPRLPRTVGAAVERALRFNTVPHDLAPAMRAYRRQPVDGTFEAVEHVPLTSGDDLERQVVVVAAHLTPGHDRLRSALAVQLTPLVLPHGSSLIPPPPCTQDVRRARVLRGRCRTL